MFTFDISEKRLNRFKEVASRRQTDLTVILENVHDLHNIGAVLRSCDAVGIDEIFIIDTDPRLLGRKLSDNKSSSTGINKWIKIHEFNSILSCITAVSEKYERIIGTALGEKSKSIHDFDYTSSTAFIFGNEKEGITPELQKHIDYNMIIPQFGFAQSLNISVACAVTLYEVLSQREQKGMYASKESSTILNRFRSIDEGKRLNKIKN